MNKTSNEETLSALMDDALGRHETDTLLAGIRNDRAALERIERYALIGMAMRDEAGQRPPVDLADGIMARIRGETAPQSKAKPAFPLDFSWLLQGWRMPAFGMALAAAVAGAAVMVVPPQQQAPDASFVALTPAPTTQNDATGLAAAQDGDSMPDPYLVQHLTYAEGGPMTAMSSNVRLVAYEHP
ncbi:MAG: hypothetical protein FNT29_04530 [Halothiobacillaceae bacterium]|nr:MAG: hypothetical protein FNT29_04530 [Halothiobacillaceae bacterium]